MNSLPKWRYVLVISVMLASAVFILVWYAVTMRSVSKDETGTQRTIIERGSIVDRNGKILAAQVRMYDIYVKHPGVSELVVQIANGLAPFLDMSEIDIQLRINNANGEVMLKRRVSAETYQRIMDLNLPGVSGRSVLARVYPENRLASQIIGFVGDEYKGLEGVEYAFNNELAGDRNKKGSRVVLTIDANIQYILEKIADSTLRETNAESVMFLAMDPRSGEILGSAVLPGFDPNNHRVSNSDLYRNQSAMDQFEPGSVFKIFSIASLMNAGVIFEHSEFICNGEYERTFPGGQRIVITCADGNAHGRVRAREIIVFSCNVGASYAADRQSNQAFYQSLRNFGFGSRTGAWVNKETAGLIRDTSLWSGRSRQSIAFGQEIAVSALQVMQAASVIANEGVLVPPKIVSHIVAPDGGIIRYRENSSNSSRRVIDPPSARRMLSYMRDATTEIGTGWRAGIGDISLAVKTGTAQFKDPITQAYSRTDFIANCIALLPAESPSLVLYIVIIKPRGEIYGGRIAAPAIREAAEELINYLGIPRGRNIILEHPGSLDFSAEELPAIGAVVPSFYSLSKKTLLPLTLRSDIRVEIYGEGWVRSQSPLPGTPVTAGMVLELYLE
jgi:cell division protein FtsI (penicillin-binding protein 3)